MLYVLSCGNFGRLILRVEFRLFVVYLKSTSVIVNVCIDGDRVFDIKISRVSKSFFLTSYCRLIPILNSDLTMSAQ